MNLIDRFRQRRETPSAVRGRWRPPPDDGIFLTDHAVKNKRPAPEAPPPGTIAAAPESAPTRQAGKTLAQRLRLGRERKAAREEAAPGDPATPHDPAQSKAPAAARDPAPRLDVVPLPDPVQAKEPAPRRKPPPTAAAKPRPAAAAPARTAPPRTPPPARAQKAGRRKFDRGDLTLAALGVTLALICALFPWYIFFNQEKFGVREMVFQGSSSSRSPSQLSYQPQLIGEHFTTGDVPRMDLDFLPTATVRNPDKPARAVPVSEQPFPSDLIQFRLVHVANGRAMIEDEDGLWVVQPGSRLPDASQVSSIEQREGRWVLVTSLDRVVELEP